MKKRAVTSIFYTEVLSCDASHGHFCKYENWVTSIEKVSRVFKMSQLSTSELVKKQYPKIQQ